MSETKTNWSKMRLKQRTKPTDLYCEVCLEETVPPKNFDYLNILYLCEHCKRTYARSRILTFDEMTEAKFERVRRRNINILKGDMRP